MMPLIISCKILLFHFCFHFDIFTSASANNSVKIDQHQLPKWFNPCPINCSHNHNFFPDHWAHENGDADEFVPEALNGTLRIVVSFTAEHLAIKEPLFKAQLANGSTRAIYGSSNVAYAFMLDMQEIFQYNLEVIRSVGWMEQGADGSVTGVGYQVISGEADVGIDISKPVSYRARRLAFLHAIKQDRVVILFRQPKVQMYRNILIRPFKGALWKCVVGFWLVLLLSIAFIIFKWQRKFTLSDFQSLWLPVVATVLARSSNLNALLRRNMNLNGCSSIRVTALVASFFGFTMYSIYSAFIVSSLRRSEVPVKSFNDLVDYNYEFMAQTSLPDFANVFVNDPKLDEYYTRVAKTNFVSLHDVMLRLFTERESQRELEVAEEESWRNEVAYFSLKFDFNYLAKQYGYSNWEICNIASLEPVMRRERPRVLAMFVSKRNASLRESLNRKILQILNRGLGHRHVKHFEDEFQPKCANSRRKVRQQIRIFDVYAAFYILSYGAMLALAVWGIGEVILPFVWNLSRKQKYQIESNENGQRIGTGSESDWETSGRFVTVQPAAPSDTK